MNSFSRIGAAPAWSRHRRWLRSRVPEGLLSWLLDSGSLTDSLKQACNGRFEVRVLGERWQRPRLDESRLLGARAYTVAWVRQVQLLCDGKPWVFARTVIPATTLTGPQRRLAHLGSRPLGAFLFADPHMRRGLVEIAPLRAGYAMFRAAVSGLERPPPEVWGRRSVFRLGGKPLLVTEVFLPPVGKTVPTSGHRRKRRAR